MVDIINYVDVPSAVPAFRILAIIDGNIHDPINGKSHSQIFGLFEESYGANADMVSYNFPGHKGKIRKATSKLVDAGRAFFDQDATRYGQGIRRYGHVLQNFIEPALPFFGIEQRSYFHFLEINLPEDGAIQELSTFAAQELMKMPVIWGAMGMGFFLPPYKSSIQMILGGTSPRYKCAIETTPDMVMDGVRREGSAYGWKAGEEPGIGDIGWRTFVGAEFWDRLSDPAELLETSGVTVDMSGSVVCVTAGERPIWGDVNKSDDISVYKAVARYLAPVRIPERCMKNFGFGGGGMADHDDKVEAYLTRFD